MSVNGYFKSPSTGNAVTWDEHNQHTDTGTAYDAFRMPTPDIPQRFGMTESGLSAQPIFQQSQQPAPVGRTSGFFSTDERDNMFSNRDLLPGQAPAGYGTPGYYERRMAELGPIQIAAAAPSDKPSFGGGPPAGTPARTLNGTAGALSQAAGAVPAWQPQQPQQPGGNVVQQGQSTGGAASPPAQPFNWGAAPGQGQSAPAGAFNTPMLDALYASQQQRMTSPAPSFNFQAKPGALTQAITS